MLAQINPQSDKENRGGHFQVIFVENIDPFSDSTGGIATYLKNLSIFLRKNHVDTVLIGATRVPNLNNIKENLKIPINNFINITNKNVSHPHYIIKLFANIWKIKFDKNVIFHAQRPDVLVPIIFFKKNTKFICSLHGVHSIAVYHKKGKTRGFIYELLERITFKKAHMFIAVDKKTEKYYVDKYPKCKNKITTIPIGIDFEKYYPQDKKTLRRKYGFKINDKIMIYVGRLEKEKNLKFLIDVYIKIKNIIGNSKLILVGTGRDETYLKRYVREMQVKDDIFWGNVENDKIPELLNCADVFGFCSLYEGSPTVIKEALACNVPVVSLDVGDIKYIIKNIKGCYISTNRVEDFANKVIEAFNNKQKFNFREQLKEYKNESVFIKTLNLYLKVMND